MVSYTSRKATLIGKLTATFQTMPLRRALMALAEAESSGLSLRKALRLAATSLNLAHLCRQLASVLLSIAVIGCQNMTSAVKTPPPAPSSSHNLIARVQQHADRVDERKQIVPTKATHVTQPRTARAKRWGQTHGSSCKALSKALSAFCMSPSRHSVTPKRPKQGAKVGLRLAAEVKKWKALADWFTLKCTRPRLKAIIHSKGAR